MAKYAPGVCNIGEGEIKRRRNSGIAGLAIAALVYAFLIYVDSSRYARLIILLPAAAGFLGILQARSRFCAYFGLRGVFNVRADVGEVDPVQEKFRAVDRRKSLKLIFYSVLLGLTVAAIGVAFP